MGFRNIDTADISTGLNSNVTLPWSLQLATDLTYFVRCGYANDAMNTDDLVWNAQLSKSVIRGRLTLALVGYDILGQLSHITYTVNAQSTTETWRNVIPATPCSASSTASTSNPRSGNTTLMKQILLVTAYTQWGSVGIAEGLWY